MQWIQNVWAGALLVFLASFIGSWPFLFVRKISSRLESTLLGVSAGVMLAATFFSLLLPGLQQFEKSGLTSFVSALYVGVLLLLGGAFIFLFHQILPHEHLHPHEGEKPHSGGVVRHPMLVVMAIALHNLPEGLAVGVGQASGDLRLSAGLSLAIALQDIPEGFIVAVGLASIGFSTKRVLAITAITGLVESVGVFLGYGAMNITNVLLPYAFSVCAGAMLFVVSHEVIPESHSRGHQREATFGVMAGFAIMMFLDRL